MLTFPAFTSPPSSAIPMAPGGTKGEAYLAGNARLAVSLRKLRRCKFSTEGVAAG